MLQTRFRHHCLPVRPFRRSIALLREPSRVTLIAIRGQAGLGKTLPAVSANILNGGAMRLRRLDAGALLMLFSISIN
jgi:hypothetical protein